MHHLIRASPRGSAEVGFFPFYQSGNKDSERPQRLLKVTQPDDKSQDLNPDLCDFRVLGIPLCLIPLFDGTAWESVILTQSQAQGGHTADWGWG